MVALREIMTPEVRTVTPETSVAEAAGAMVRGRFGSVLVATGSTLVGILTERDVLRTAAEGGDTAVETVRNWMTPDPVTAGPADDSEAAEQQMLSGGFRHLPVVEDGATVGIVSLRDLFAARIRRTKASDPPAE